MPRKAGTTIIQIQNITHEQKVIIDSIIEKTGESKNSMLKRLLAAEAERLGINWIEDDSRAWVPRTD